MTCGYIYKIQFPNGKHYIGLTSRTLDQRKQQHRCSAKKGDTQILYNAIRKYDMIDTFELIEIDTAETIEELYELEIGYILMYNSYMDENGYNMTFGGDGTFGYIRTEEDKEKQSERQKKHFEKNPEARQKAIEGLKKYNENPEARVKNSDSKKKHYKDNPEARRNLSDGKGKNKPFDVFTRDLTFIKTFSYQFEAREYLQKEYHIISIIKISEVLSGERKNSHGFIFKYK